MAANTNGRHMREWKPWTTAQSAAVKEYAARKERERMKQEQREEQKHAQFIQPEGVAKPFTRQSAKVQRETAMEKYAPIFDTIRKAVCANVGADPEMLCTLTRNPKVVAARMLTVYLVREHTPLSYPQIRLLMAKETTGHSTELTMMKRLHAKWNEPMHMFETRTFKQVAEAFDRATLTFREESK